MATGILNYIFFAENAKKKTKTETKTKATSEIRHDEIKRNLKI